MGISISFLMDFYSKQPTYEKPWFYVLDIKYPLKRSHRQRWGFQKVIRSELDWWINPLMRSQFDGITGR